MQYLCNLLTNPAYRGIVLLINAPKGAFFVPSGRPQRPLARLAFDRRFQG